MNRRAFVVGAMAALAAGRVLAQVAARIPRVGVILVQPIPNPFQQAFRAGLRELGYVEGKTVQVDFRSIEGHPERYAKVVAELVALGPDVLVAGGGAMAVRAAKKATNSIPIIFPATSDPLGEGLVQSLARPGGNVTGLSILEEEVNAKRLQLVKELMPQIQRVAVLLPSTAVTLRKQSEAVQAAARALKLEARVFTAGTREELEPAIDAAIKAGAEALIVAASAVFAVNRDELIRLVAERRMVTVWEHRQFALAGGLLSYGPDITDLYRNAARYVDKILKGAKPAELPVEQASKLELVINLKTAKALGLKIPGTLLVRADQVMQ
jgi:putative ABC transport system substrate-binding protein